MLEMALQGYHGMVPTLPSPHSFIWATYGNEDLCYRAKLPRGLELGLDLELGFGK